MTPSNVPGPLSGKALDRLFRDARTFSHWLDLPVEQALLREIATLMRLAPTSANCGPARIVFVASREAKERLRPALSAGNVDKTMSAPVTAIVGHDLDFPETLPALYPPADARSWFAGKPDLIAQTAFRNGSLQGAYLIMAARALGLDCGPMSGFDQAAVKAAFFPADRVEVNFLCNLGYGDRTRLHPRLPRPDFERFCAIV
jgi:3-hydroxypropanoate dehydrogenase